MALRRLLLIRHGETEAAPGNRFLGSSDAPLSDEGRTQMRQASGRVRQRPVDAFVASNVKRCWQGAALLSGGGNIRLMAELREIHFGRWEGLTREEVEAADPVLYQDWQNGADGFEYPNGEARAEYTARIHGALETLEASGPRDLVAVLDAGVIAEIARQLTGQSLSEDALGLGETVVLTRTADGWIVGAHSSDPAGLANDAAA